MDTQKGLLIQEKEDWMHLGKQRRGSTIYHRRRKAADCGQSVALEILRKRHMDVDGRERGRPRRTMPPCKCSVVLDSEGQDMDVETAVEGQGPQHPFGFCG